MQGTRKQAAAWGGMDLSSTELTKLYEVYSGLHRLGQQTHIPINIPIVTVVGHQTDGKSGAALRPRSFMRPCAACLCRGSCDEVR